MAEKFCLRNKNVQLRRKKAINQIAAAEWCLLPSQAHVTKINTLQAGNLWVLVCASDAVMVFLSEKSPESS